MVVNDHRNVPFLSNKQQLQDKVYFISTLNEFFIFTIEFNTWFSSGFTYLAELEEN